MAYWLFCQACKQWSKFATPLSEDKYCSYCNSSFIAPKQPIQPTLANLSTVPAEDTQPQMSQTEEAEVSQADDSLAVVQPDSAEIDTDLELQTIEVKEKATEDKAAQTPEETTPQESLETTESEDDGTALEIAVESTVPEIDEVSQEPRESTSEYSSQFSDELDGTSEIQEPPADQPENLESAMIFDGPEVTEDAKMEEMPPGKEPYHPTTAPSTAKIVFSHTKSDMEEKPARSEKLDSQENSEAEDPPDESEPLADMETEKSQETDEITNDNQEPEITDSQNIVEESDTFIESVDDQEASVGDAPVENQDSQQIPEESEADNDDESSHNSATRHVPAHRLYFENQRRKKRRRYR